jgi:hypothetical protein
VSTDAKEQTKLKINIYDYVEEPNNYPLNEAKKKKRNQPTIT